MAEFDAASRASGGALPEENSFEPNRARDYVGAVQGAGCELCPAAWCYDATPCLPLDCTSRL